jgi:hypothetical protein
MEIERMLVLSTRHLTEHTCNTILPVWTGPAWEKTEYGWFVYANIEDISAEPPEDLRQCIRYAQNPGVSCDWIMFDRDGPTVDELPTYDW